MILAQLLMAIFNLLLTIFQVVWWLLKLPFMLGRRIIKGRRY